ncbi:unnamed protein product [Pleuronectes platessa]|uniref:Uncharacterized protein n=1 Tax=Pleuronectes platessa TaxID=8262 RepID=A0A9N7Y9L6_PLEPL|nr:unnamed protein product [Pleuronectes platessa]
MGKGVVLLHCASSLTFSEAEVMVGAAWHLPIHCKSWHLCVRAHVCVHSGAVDRYDKLTSTCYHRECVAQCYLSELGLPGAPEHQLDQATGQPEIIETGNRAMRGHTEAEGGGGGAGTCDRRTGGRMKAGEKTSNQRNDASVCTAHTNWHHLPFVLWSSFSQRVEHWSVLEPLHVGSLSSWISLIECWQRSALAAGVSHTDGGLAHRLPSTLHTANTVVCACAGERVSSGVLKVSLEEHTPHTHSSVTTERQQCSQPGGSGWAGNKAGAVLAGANERRPGSPSSGWVGRRLRIRRAGFGTEGEEHHSTACAPGERQPLMSSPPTDLAPWATSMKNGWRAGGGGRGGSMEGETDWH